jgi:hypothetical protein
MDNPSLGFKDFPIRQKRTECHPGYIMRLKFKIKN